MQIVNAQSKKNKNNNNQIILQVLIPHGFSCLARDCATLLTQHAWQLFFAGCTDPLQSQSSQKEIMTCTKSFPKMKIENSPHVI